MALKNTAASNKPAAAAGNKGKSQVKDVNKAQDEEEDDIERVEFDLVESEDPKLFPFTVRVEGDKRIGTPKGFDPDKHLPLKRKYFATGEAYGLYRAEQFQLKADEWRAKAAEEGKMGDGKQRSQAKKLLAMQSRMAELTKLLTAQGLDVNAILAQAKTEAEASDK